MQEELTEEQLVYYANFALIDECDGTCGDKTVPIYNYRDGKNYLTWVGKYLYYQKCMADSYNGNTPVS